MINAEYLLRLFSDMGNNQSAAQPEDNGDQQQLAQEIEQNQQEDMQKIDNLQQQQQKSFSYRRKMLRKK